MSGTVNKVILVANLGRDPEVKTMATGDKIVNLALATSERWKDKQTGERKEKTEWHRVVVFDPNIADVCERYLRKGAKVYVEGQLQTRKWTDQSGNDRYSTEVVLQRFRGTLTMLDGKGDGGGDQSRPHDAPSGYRETAKREPGRAPVDLDDDIPF